MVCLFKLYSLYAGKITLVSGIFSDCNIPFDHMLNFRFFVSWLILKFPL